LISVDQDGKLHLDETFCPSVTYPDISLVSDKLKKQVVAWN
jgi:hypothetical protein